MDIRKWKMYTPIIIVLVLSIPLVTAAQWMDFKEARRLADEVVDSSGFFTGFSEDTSTTVDLIPGSIIDSAIDDTEENITITDSSGNQQNITQPTARKSVLTGVITAVVMVGLAIVAAFGIFFLFRLKKRITLKLFFAIALGLCASIAVMLYLYLMRMFVNDLFGTAIDEGNIFYGIIIALGAVIGITIVYNMVFKAMEPKRKNPALIAFCIFLGPFLAIVLPVWVIIFLLAGVALWDLWAAKRGIIKEMINLSEKHREEERNGSQTVEHHEVAAAPLVEVQRPLKSQLTDKIEIKRGGGKRKFIDVQSGEDITSYGLYEGKHFALGIGDFIFFSVLVSVTFKWMMLKVPFMGFYESFWGEILALEMTIIVIGAVLYGFKQTLGFLEKESVMPGLPLSVLWGLVGFIVLAAYLEVMNLIFYGQMVNPF
ncbi:MAG: hypothetical protein ACMUHB_02470 [Thermoplasmatota archaeon]